MNAFNWKSQPSEIAEALKPSTMTRKANLSPKRLYSISKKSDEILRDRFGGAYSKATSADAAREWEIEQVNREVERHFGLAQTAPTDALKATHREEARRLAAKVKALVCARPAAYVAYLEQQRGI